MSNPDKGNISTGGQSNTSISGVDGSKEPTPEGPKKPTEVCLSEKNKKKTANKQKKTANKPEYTPLEEKVKEFFDADLESSNIPDTRTEHNFAKIMKYREHLPSEAKEKLNDLLNKRCGRRVVYDVDVTVQEY
jgi:hypothetical protein